MFPIFLSGTALGEEYVAIGAPICGYGQYRIGNECYSYGSDNYGECDGDSVDGAGYNFSVPLYTDKLTQPAMHFKIYEKSSGEHKMCYMNMLPRQGKDKLAVQYYDTVYYSSK